MRIALPDPRKEILRFGEQIRLVEHIDRALALRRDVASCPWPISRVVQPHLPEHALHHFHLLLPPGLRSVDHMQQQVCFPRFLERGAERGDQMVRQLPEEADWVADAEPKARAEPTPT